LAAGQTILNDTGKLNARPATRARNLVDGVHADTAASSWQARQKLASQPKVTLAFHADVPARAVLW
jgi:hypothetical protein